MFTKRFTRVTIDAMLPFLKYLPFMPPSISDDINNVIDEIVRKRRKENAETGVVKKDLLQIFLDTNDADPVGFSMKHLREEMHLFMIAGSDTTSYTLTRLLLLLVNNPEKLEALLTEIDSAFPSREESITFAKTQDLQYLNAVINESMRLMSVITAGLPRITTEETVLCNHKLPAGTVVSSCVSDMMTDPRIWPDPNSFIPERWIQPYKGIEADRKAFMPFSAGSRNCPGQQFALKNLRLTMVRLLLRYDFSLIAGQSHEQRSYTVPVLVQGYYKIGVKMRAA